MATDTNTAARRHIVVTTSLGELTLVRDADAVRGLYCRRYRPSPGPETFGRRCDDGFGEVLGRLGEHLAGQRRTFDLAVARSGAEFQQWVRNRCAGAAAPG